METTINKPTRFRLVLNIRISENIRQWTIIIIALACVFLFASAAYSKIANQARFVHGLSRVAYVGNYAPIIGWLVPTAEILIAALLVIPQSRNWGLFSFTWLMTVFSLYIFSMLLWAQKLPCNCNLFIEDLSWGAHLAFNIGCIVISSFAIWLSRIKNY